MKVKRAQSAGVWEAGCKLNLITAHFHPVCDETCLTANEIIFQVASASAAK